MRLSFLRLLLLLWTLAVVIKAEPVTFHFEPPDDVRNPLARELWAEVTTPSQKKLTLPAFFWGGGKFAVRARSDEAGEYRLGKITESTQGRIVEIAAKIDGSGRKQVRRPSSMPAVRVAADGSGRFVLGTGGDYVPIGSNLAWATGRNRAGFYRRAMSEFSEAGLNWMRVWMAHWGGLNLEWLPDDMGPSPPAGTLDLRVAENWDRLIELAEKNGVYLQVVLQHHGQYTTGANPNWRENPWNVAHVGGFLFTPADFFTSPFAREFTARKYRYIVARWGYSPAVMAWELFNEVHWTDALGKNRDVAAVARWHAEMAAWLRLVDAYDHLVTTSTDRDAVPVADEMDFLQPHLYSPAMLTAVRRLEAPRYRRGRPVFYGEVGDDHMKFPDEMKASGLTVVPPVWASLMGESRYAAQPWRGDLLLEKKRLGEMAAIAGFVRATKICSREGLHEFTAAVQSPERVPLVLRPGQVWQRRPEPVIDFPTDGREPAALAEMPQILVGSDESIADGFPARATVNVHLVHAVRATLRVSDAGVKGAVVRIRVDGAIVAEYAWPPLEVAVGESLPARPQDLLFDLSAGAHQIVIENSGGQDWIDLAGVDFGMDAPAVLAVGKRNENFIALWLWHRERIFSSEAAKTGATATVWIEDVPAGKWQVTWWDTIKGTPSGPAGAEHAGGRLALTVPEFARHTAVVLVRE